MRINKSVTSEVTLSVSPMRKKLFRRPESVSQSKEKKRANLVKNHEPVQINVYIYIFYFYFFSFMRETDALILCVR